VDALQSYVAGLTGIAVADQILMCEGVPLDPAKPLSAYKLPSLLTQLSTLFEFVRKCCFAACRSNIHGNRGRSCRDM
jgi:hypothetical protein